MKGQCDGLVHRGCGCPMDTDPRGANVVHLPPPTFSSGTIVPIGQPGQVQPLYCARCGNDGFTLDRPARPPEGRIPLADYGTKWVATAQYDNEKARADKLQAELDALKTGRQAKEVTVKMRGLAVSPLAFGSPGPGVPVAQAIREAEALVAKLQAEELDPSRCTACGWPGLSLDKLGGACPCVAGPDGTGGCPDPTAWLRGREKAVARAARVAEWDAKCVPPRGPTTILTNEQMELLAGRTVRRGCGKLVIPNAVLQPGSAPQDLHCTHHVDGYCTFIQTLEMAAALRPERFLAQGGSFSGPALLPGPTVRSPEAVLADQRLAALRALIAEWRKPTGGDYGSVANNAYFDGKVAGMISCAHDLEALLEPPTLVVPPLSPERLADLKKHWDEVTRSGPRPVIVEAGPGLSALALAEPDPRVHLMTGIAKPAVLVACKAADVQNSTPTVDDVTCPDCLTALVVTP